MIHVSFTELRAKLAAYMDRAIDDHDTVLITRQGREPVVMVSQSDWEGMQETRYLLASPANAAALRESIAELNAGGGVERELIETPPSA
jgi:antitoxin YefM